MDNDMDMGNGGRLFSSNWLGGGGGKPSIAVGELELCLMSELSEGENIPRGGKACSGLVVGQGCGVLPDPMEYGVVPVAAGGQ